jgi:hypothetical protein
MTLRWEWSYKCNKSWWDLLSGLVLIWSNMIAVIVMLINYHYSLLYSNMKKMYRRSPSRIPKNLIKFALHQNSYVLILVAIDVELSSPLLFYCTPLQSLLLVTCIASCEQTSSLTVHTVLHLLLYTQLLYSAPKPTIRLNCSLANSATLSYRWSHPGNFPQVCCHPWSSAVSGGASVFLERVAHAYALTPLPVQQYYMSCVQ